MTMTLVAEVKLVSNVGWYKDGYTSTQTNNVFLNAHLIIISFDNTVQIEYDTRTAGEFYVGHNDSTSLTLTEINYLYSSTIEVIKYSSNVTVVFANGPSIMIKLLTSGRLDFALFVKENRIVQVATPYGLLGNFNNFRDDDVIMRGNLIVLSQPYSEQDVHNFSQSCKLQVIGLRITKSVVMGSEEF